LLVGNAEDFRAFPLALPPRSNPAGNQFPHHQEWIMRVRNILNYWRNLPLLSIASLLTLWMAAAPAEAKTPGKTYCFRGFCHRVLTLTETQKLVGTHSSLITSNYDDCKRDRFNPCGLTSSGAVFRADLADNAASPILPDGTVIMVRHPKTQKTAVLRVNSAGPYHHKRTLDVSHAAAGALGFQRQGVATLEVRVLQAPTKAEAGYRKNRVYPPVPGYLGMYASLDQAGTAYAGLGGPETKVAALYPQTSNEPGSVRPVGGITDNGIERTWLAKAVTFGVSKREAKVAKSKAIKQARLERAKLERRARRHG
jgi:rare lipoprotein A